MKSKKPVVLDAQTRVKKPLEFDAKGRPFPELQAAFAALIKQESNLPRKPSKAPRPYKIQIDIDLGGSWYYRLRAPNGKIMQIAETYDSLANCKRAANSFGKLLRVAYVVEVLGARAGR